MKTGIHQPERSWVPVQVPRSADLSTWVRHTWEDGLQIEDLWPGDELVVVTGNSTYEITVLSPASRDIVVRGGRFFAEKAHARLDGCSLGGAFLKMGGIYVGFALELRGDDGVIVTSRVRSVGFVQHG